MPVFQVILEQKVAIYFAVVTVSAPSSGAKALSS